MAVKANTNTSDDRQKQSQEVASGQAKSVVYTHDPQRVVEDIRDQLAAADKPLAFLFGAGTSGVNIAPDPPPGQKRKVIPLIPGIGGLTDQCRNTVCALGKKHKEAWSNLEQHCKEESRFVNIENILSTIQTRIEGMGASDQLSGLTKAEWKDVEKSIRQAIAKAVLLEGKTIPDHMPQDDFASWVSRCERSLPLEIFTINYDVLIERSLERAGVPLFDGFVGAYEPFFCPDSLERTELCSSPRWTRLWKIHGSVNWQLKKRQAGVQVIRTQPSTTGEMILPSRLKYDESRKMPYTAMLDLLARTVDRDASVLMTCGYSFGDEHVNSTIFTALDNMRRAHVIALMHDALTPDADVVRRAQARPNFVVVGPNGGVIKGQWAEWRLLSPVDASTHSYMDLSWDSQAAPEQGKGAADPDNPSLQGQMKLGDFEWFCKFLLTIARESGDET
jgi:hypothetical protein